MSKYYQEEPIPETFTGDVKIGHYKNGDVSLTLVDKETGLPLTILTVVMPEYSTPKGYVLMNPNGSNEGILQVLIDKGIVSDPIVNVWGKAGFHSSRIPYALCKLLEVPDGY